jgi:hypothetical protein
MIPIPSSPERTPVPEHAAALFTPPLPLVPLTHPGVVRLQEAICRREITRRLDLRIRPEGLGTALGRFGGVDRILASLLTAAGGRRALASCQELSHRLQVVLPIFLRILEMQGSADLKLPERIPRRKRKQFLSFPYSLYPDAIEAARGRIIRENRLRRWRGHLHHLEILKEECRFGLYIDSLDLLHRLDIGKDRLEL